MKRSMNYLLLLSLFAAIPAIAKTNPAKENKNNTAPANIPATQSSAKADSTGNDELIPQDIFEDEVYADELTKAKMENTDSIQAALSLNVHPNPTSGVLTIKTNCPGKIYFFSKKGKEKGECFVNEGETVIALENLLFPGTYICRFEGVNGAVTETKVIYKL